MTTHSQNHAGDRAIAEMKEFATFPARTQRYIRRALDIALERDDVVTRWSRDAVEEVEIKVHTRAYGAISLLKGRIPEDGGLDAVEPFMGGLVRLSAFDLGQDRLPHFRAYRFLYERLLGAAARPWLPGAFCAASSLPHLHPEKRKTLLQSLTETEATAAGWSAREPAFYPSWVDKVEAEAARPG